MLHRALGHHTSKRFGRFDDDREAISQSHAVGRVHHVAAGQAPVQVPTGGLAHHLGDCAHEGHHIMVGDLLVLFDPLGALVMSLLTDVGHLLVGDLSAAVKSLGGGDLPLGPPLKFGLFIPDGGHGFCLLALNHGIRIPLV